MPASVAPGNQDQLDAWDGAQGQFWRHWADRFDDGVARYTEHLLAAVAARPDYRVLDVGCGSGRVSRDVARQAPAGSVLGVDLSSPLLSLAAERAAAEGLENVVFEHGDAQVHPFPASSFDVVVSRHGVMFFADPAAAFTNLHRALRPGGRLTLVTWQPAEKNPWISGFRSALELPPPPPPTSGPFSLSDPDQVQELFAAQGFEDVTLTDLREAMWYGRDTEDAFAFLAAQFATPLAGMTPTQRERTSHALRADLDEHMGRVGVQYDSAAWLIEARRPR